MFKKEITTKTVKKVA